MSDQPPEIPVKKARKSLVERISIVWIVPLMALLVALGVAWQSYVDQGPLITIVFDDASGIAADETEVRYRDVTVGVVEEVGFTDELNQVAVEVRLSKDVGDYVDEDATFWVVRPEVSAQGVTGLDTVLSGVFIEGIWDSEPGGLQDEFIGQSSAPLNRDGRDGLQIRLRVAGNARLTDRAPIEYRGIQVGRVGVAEVSEDGATIEADAIIFAPHDQLVTSATRFWDTSGFTFTIGTSGAEIDFSSLAQLVSGGISFGTVVSGGEPVEDGSDFALYSDEATARASLFSEDDGGTLTFTAIFDENVSGLTVDAPVDFGGLRVGRVESINGVVNEERFGDSRVRLGATLQIRPSRLGLEDAVSQESALAFFEDRVENNNLRARLVTASLLTGGLKVELTEVDEIEPATIDLDGDPNPIFPTAPAAVSDVQASAEGVLERVNALPIEELLDSAIGALDNVSRLAGSEDIRAVPGDVRALIADARGIIGSEQLQALPDQIGTVATEIESLVTALNEQEAVAQLIAAIGSIDETATTVTEAVAGVPSVIDRVDAIAANVQELPLDVITSNVTSLLANADGLLTQTRVAVGDVGRIVSSDEMQALPGQIGSVAGQLEEITTSLNEQEAVTRLLEAVGSIEETADSVSAAVEGVPAVVDRVDAIAASVQEMPLGSVVDAATELLANSDTLVTQTRGAVTDVRAIIGTEEMQALPGRLVAITNELETVIATLNEEEAVARLLSAVDEISEVARTAGDSFAGVPGLVEELNTIAAEIEELPLSEVVTRVNALLESADALIGTDAARALPEDLSAALNELQLAISELRDGGLIANANATLGSARAAADNVSTAAASLPSLLAQAQQVLAQASTTIGGYSSDREVGREINAAVREINRAAAAVTSLARELERNPNSLLFGR
ncbi:MlaD family protein [Pelagovum pacificum]|uniref:MCE family protein n=1 Tax=Pelagovum pacificum TaxID=2588711 RepID=A0A5C5GH93_9RHOB|nr:MlaD family protein [Pelagovum pacificum]QQA43586.1 MCE family protein [Pelagovum pacificum]TNY33279.1 MCE family protein [Pelagovum pacificum]